MEIGKFNFQQNTKIYQICLEPNESNEVLNIPYQDKNVVSFCIINNILKGSNGVEIVCQYLLPKLKDCRNYRIMKVDTEKMFVTLKLI